MFSFFKKSQRAGSKLDTSTPLKFKESILAKSASISDLSDPTVFQSWAKKENTREYMQVLEDLALRGNVPSQEFVAQFYVMTAARVTNKDARLATSYKALKFGVLAAESGVATEALNVPITAMKLSSMVVEKNGQIFTEEAQSLVQMAHKWHSLNSKNQSISVADRRRSAEEASKLKNAWPELDEQQDSPTAHGSAADREAAMLRIVLAILRALGSDAPPAVNAGEMAKEALQYVPTTDLSRCNVDAAAIFVLMKVAVSALEDEERGMAEMLVRKCKPIAKSLMATPSCDYTDLEFSMIDGAIEAMKKVEFS